MTVFVCGAGTPLPRPLEDGDAVVWVGPSEADLSLPPEGRHARFVGDLGVEADRRAAVEMAEELFGGPVEVVTMAIGETSG